MNFEPAWSNARIVGLSPMGIMELKRHFDGIKRLNVMENKDIFHGKGRLRLGRPAKAR
jgi:hypothetical protein